MSCDISIILDLNDDTVVFAESGCEVEIAIEPEVEINVQAFDWPPMLDGIIARVKKLEDNPPPTIDIDDTVTEESPNAVKSSGIWTFLAALWDSLMEALGLHTQATANAHPASAIGVDASEFSGNLTTDDDTVQKVAAKVDALSTGGGGDIGWDKIVDYTLPEDAFYITINKTSEGAALSIPNGKKFIIIANHQFVDDTTGLVNTDGRTTYRFNSITNSVYRFTTNLVGYFQVSLSNRYNNFTVIEGIVSDYIYANTKSLGNTAAGANYSVASAPVVVEQVVTEINNIAFIRAAGGYNFKAGTNIKIYIL